MKYLRWLWLSLILGIVGTGLFMSAQLLVQAQTVTNLPERILDFSSEIEITQDTSLNITETITYQTQTDRHGFTVTYH